MAAGAHTVKLFGWDDDMTRPEQPTWSGAVAIGPIVPVATIGMSEINEGDTASVTFSAPADVDSWEVAWDIRSLNGTLLTPFVQTFGPTTANTSTTATNLYADDNGTGTPQDDYTIRVTAIRNGARYDANPLTFTVQNVAPSWWTTPTLSQTTIYSGDSVTLSGTFTDPAMAFDGFSYELDWGDGTVETGALLSEGLGFSHTFTVRASYVVSLTIEDDDGGVLSWDGMVDVINGAPNAEADSFMTYSGLRLTVSDPNILDNDDDSESDPMFARIVSLPLFGTLHRLDGSDLSVGDLFDGAFVYVSESGYVGADSIQYVATDLSDESAPTTVAINVLDFVLDLAADSNNDETLDPQPGGSDDSVEEEEPGVALGYGGLTEARLTLSGISVSELSGYSLRLRGESGSQTIRIWDSPERENEISLPAEFPLELGASFPPSVWIEGADSGTAVLELALIDPADDGRIVRKDRVNVTVARIGSMRYMDTGEGTTGDLYHDNPIGHTAAGTGELITPDFGGGYRFFPDYASIDQIGGGARNIVRVRVTLETPTAGVPVYFRSFDVDDPSQKWEIDPNDFVDTQGTVTLLQHQFNRGGDNRGTVYFANGMRLPGESKFLVELSTSGYAGLLGPAGTNAVAFPSGSIVIIRTNAAGVAEVDLYTSYAPGDNFRVVASTNLKVLEDLNKTPNVDGLFTMDDVPVVGQIAKLGDFGKATEQLAIWRRLHIEQDRMAAVESDDFLSAVTVIGSEPHETSAGQYWIVTDYPGADLDVPAENQYAGGILRQDGVNYRILASTAGPVVKFLLEADLSNGVIAVYTDDFIATGNDVPTTQMNPQDEALASQMYAFMQESTSRPENRFADAYIQPVLVTLDDYDSSDANVGNSRLVTPTPNTGDGDAVLDPVSQIHQVFSGGKGFESDLFWVVYLSTAYERGGEGDEIYTEIGRTSLDRQASLVYVEAAKEYAQKGTINITTNAPWTIDEIIAWTAIHEVGHQFLLDPNPNDLHREGTNIMDGFPFEQPNLTDSLYYFALEDIFRLRMRVKSPGT